MFVSIVNKRAHIWTYGNASEYLGRKKKANIPHSTARLGRADCLQHSEKVVQIQDSRVYHIHSKSDAVTLYCEILTLHCFWWTTDVVQTVFEMVGTYTVGWGVAPGGASYYITRMKWNMFYLSWLTAEAGTNWPESYGSFSSWQLGIWRHNLLISSPKC